MSERSRNEILRNRNDTSDPPPPTTMQRSPRSNCSIRQLKASARQIVLASSPPHAAALVRLRPFRHPNQSGCFDPYTIDLDARSVCPKNLQSVRRRRRHGLLALGEEDLGRGEESIRGWSKAEDE